VRKGSSSFLKKAEPARQASNVSLYPRLSRRRQQRESKSFLLLFFKKEVLASYQGNFSPR
jgi:hypothetical protein